jgi:hypothetical protein
MAWVMAINSWVLRAGLLLASIAGIADASAIERQEISVVPAEEMLVQFQRFGHIASKLPPEIIQQEIIYPRFMQSYDWACRLPVGGYIEAYMRIKEQRTFVGSGNPLYRVPATIMVEWAQHLPLQCIRSFFRSTLALTKDPNFLDVMTEFSGNSINPDVHLFLDHARALMLVKLISPCLARCLGCTPDEVPAKLDLLYGTNMVQDPSWSAYKEFYPAYPLVDYVMRCIRDGKLSAQLDGKSYLDDFVGCRLVNSRRHLLVKLKDSDEIGKSFLRCISLALPRSFFQAIHAYLGEQAVTFDTMSLDLYGHYFPAGIVEFADKLTELRMVGLQAHTLPAAIGQLTHLKKLTLQGHLNTLPVEIAQLHNLKGKGSLVLPELEQLPDSQALRAFLVNQTKALSSKQYDHLTGKKISMMARFKGLFNRRLGK